MIVVGWGGGGLRDKTLQTERKGGGEGGRGAGGGRERGGRRERGGERAIIVDQQWQSNIGSATVVEQQWQSNNSRATMAEQL